MFSFSSFSTTRLAVSDSTAELDAFCSSDEIDPGSIPGAVLGTVEIDSIPGLGSIPLELESNFLLNFKPIAGEACN